MGADAYNWYNCREGINTAWWTLERIIKPFRDFGALHPNEELWLTEWASAEDSAVPNRKAQWLTQAQDLFKRSDYAQFKGVAYFDRFGGDNCYWFSNSSSTTFAAFRAMGQDPFYGGTVAPPPPDPEPTTIQYVASASRNANLSSHTVTVPSSVQVGDTLLLFFGSNSSSVSTAEPAGWTPVQGVAPSGMRGRVWTRTATAADLGASITVRSSSFVKADLTVAAYRGTSTSPIDVSAAAVDTTQRTQHTAPAVTPSRAGNWIVTYWADKSDLNTSHSIPASVTKRAATTGSSGGHITATVADTGAGVGAVSTGPFTAVGTAAATKAVMFTIALQQ
jgi:hypothetical protein